MKIFYSLLLISLFLFTYSCQKEEDPSFLGVPGGGKDGITKAYTLFMLSSLYGGLPNCSLARYSFVDLELNSVVTGSGLKSGYYHLLKNAKSGDTVILKNIHETQIDTEYGGFIFFVLRCLGLSKYKPPCCL